LVNVLIFRIQDLPASKISEISLSVWEIGFYWLLLILFLLLWRYPGKKLVISFLTLIMIGGILRITGTIFQQKNKEIFIYALNQGRAIDFMNRSSLYHFEEMDSKDYSYSILPNRGALRAIDSNSLLAFQKEKGLELVLPEIDGNLLLQDKELIFSDFGPFRTVFEWKEGSWEKSELGDTLRLGEKALKVRFK